MIYDKIWTFMINEPGRACLFWLAFIIILVILGVALYDCIKRWFDYG